MNRSVVTMPGGGDGVAPMFAARERDGEGRRRSAARADADARAMRRRRRSFTLPMWFNIAATGAVAAAIAVGVLLQA